MFQHADPRDDETEPPEINGPHPCPLNRGRVANGRPEGWHWYDVVTQPGSGHSAEDYGSGCECGLVFWYDITLTVKEE